MAKCTGVRCPMQHGYKADECNQTDCPYRTEPMTNADRVRAMTDEELAETISKITFDVYNCNESRTEYIELLKTRNKCDDRCGNCVLNWLKQPAE